MTATKNDGPIRYRPEERRETKVAKRDAIMQVNVRADPTFTEDILLVMRETRIPDRSSATRYAVHREATRIRNRLRRKTR